LLCSPYVEASVRDVNALKRSTATASKTSSSNNKSNNIKTRTLTNTNKTAAVPTTRTSVRETQTNNTTKIIKKAPTRRSALTLKTTVNETKRLNVLSRVAATKNSNEESTQQTKVGAAYEQCKTAFFTCMDQFCKLKNDSYRRCSCSDRVYSFDNITDTLQQAKEKLTEFSENLDVIGLTREQALSMKTASEGEIALAEDKSSSKQLLQAIMNSINGKDTKVGGKYSDLNSLNLSSDTSNAFGTNDTGQIIASYNGLALYSAVFPQCKESVVSDCNEASLQRAVNAYLMAIEQDCNTVASALSAQQKQLNTAVHEESVMLDMARIENRQKHNTDSMSTCLANVEQSIQSEEVCGKNYYKCLDNGKYIDVSTGAPIEGIADFYKLGQLLTFNSSVDIDKQKLSTIANNREFVQIFESKTKQFAEDALDKCSEKADIVWQDFLDRALVDIYYAQQAKVNEIQQSCFELVAACYEKQEEAVSKSVANLTGNYVNILYPDSVKLVTSMCSDYVQSCNNLFGGNIVEEYLTNKDDTDVLAACRNIAQQCFLQYGGNDYENFYYPYSGIFDVTKNNALDWFSLYDKTGDENKETDENVLSPCAKKLSEIGACKGILQKVFGGLDKYKKSETASCYSINQPNNGNCERELRSVGVATEVYYKITDSLSKHCETLGGYFVEPKFTKQYGYNQNDFCLLNTDDSDITALSAFYNFVPQEDVCPSGYKEGVDILSWGACSCWEKGGRRSKDGKIKICKSLLPSNEERTESNPICDSEKDFGGNSYAINSAASENHWCVQQVISSDGKVCPTLDLKTNGEGDIVCDIKQEDMSDVRTYIIPKIPNHN